MRNKTLAWMALAGLLCAGCGVTTDLPGKEPTEEDTPTPAPPTTPTPQQPDPLNASIVMTGTSGTAPFDVEFSAEVTGGTAPYSFEWVFGDGAGQSTDEAPAYTFDAEGMYDVSLVVTDSGAQTANAATQISVLAAPLPDLVVTRNQVTISYFVDAYEPNDTQARYLGAAPDTWTLDAYLDSRDLTFTTEVSNLGEADAGAFYVDLFPNNAAAPQVGDESATYATVDALAAGDKVTLEFSLSDVDAGSRKAWALADTTEEVEEALENNNVSNKLAFTVYEDIDWFYLDADQGQTLTIGLTNLPRDYDMVLYGPGDTLIDSSANGGIADESITATVETSGYHLIGIYGYNGARSSAAPYHLTVTAE